MSEKQNTMYVEAMQDSFEQARYNEDFGTMAQILNHMYTNGFTQDANYLKEIDTDFDDWYTNWVNTGRHIDQDLWEEKNEDLMRANGWKAYATR